MLYTKREQHRQSLYTLLLHLGTRKQLFLWIVYVTSCAQQLRSTCMENFLDYATGLESLLVLLCRKVWDVT